MLATLPTYITALLRRILPKHVKLRLQFHIPAYLLRRGNFRFIPYFFNAFGADKGPDRNHEGDDGLGENVRPVQKVWLGRDFESVICRFCRRVDYQFFGAPGYGDHAGFAFAVRVEFQWELP